MVFRTILDREGRSKSDDHANSIHLPHGLRANHHCPEGKRRCDSYSESNEVGEHNLIVDGCDCLQ